MRSRQLHWPMIILATLVQACSLWSCPLGQWLPTSATETPTATRKATSTATATLAPTATGTTAAAPPSSDDEPFLGPLDAPVTMIGFSDFACGFCRSFHQETLPILLEMYPDELRYVYRDFPIVGGGEVGFEAAQAAECADEQGAYWEYHTALMSGEFALRRDGYGQIADQLGLDTTALLQCLDSGRYYGEVLSDREAGRGMGVSATPTFFINGVPVIGAQVLAAFTGVIDEALGK